MWCDALGVFGATLPRNIDVSHSYSRCLKMVSVSKCTRRWSKAVAGARWRSPLVIAAGQFGCDGCVAAMLQAAGADKRAVCKATRADAARATIAAVLAGHHAVVGMFLRSWMLDRAALASEPLSAVWLAVRRRDPAMARLLVASSGLSAMHSLSFGGTAVAGQTPLHLACANGDVEMSRTLLELGADLCAPDDNHETPLHLACAVGAVGVLQQLVEASSAVFSQANVLIGDGRSCLSVACEKGQLEVVLFLVRVAVGR
jgi:hypothetical protein